MDGVSVSTPCTNVYHLQEKQLALYLAFLDVAKAYDSEDRETRPLKGLCVIKLLHKTPHIQSN